MESNDQQQQQTGAIQVMPTVLGNGQQIILQSLQQQLNANGQQQIQVVPIIQGAQGTSYIVQPQVQSQPQIVQLPDGQTFFYHQPMMTDAQQAQPQIVNINGNFFQIPAQQTVTQAAIQSQQNTATSPGQQTQQVVMIPSASTETQIQQSANVNNFNTNSATSPPPQASSSSTPTPPVESEEEPLYVNASKLKRIFHQLDHVKSKISF